MNNKELKEELIKNIEDEILRYKLEGDDDQVDYYQRVLWRFRTLNENLVKDLSDSIKYASVRNYTYATTAAFMVGECGPELFFVPNTNLT